MEPIGSHLTPMSSKMVRMKTNPERGRLLKRSMPTAVTVITDRNYEKPLKKRSLFRVEEKNKWWTERFNEDKGDSSKVLEITISDDDDDDFQCTFHYGTGKPVVEPAAKPADDLFKQKQDCKVLMAQNPLCPRFITFPSRTVLLFIRTHY